MTDYIPRICGTCANFLNGYMCIDEMINRNFRTVPFVLVNGGDTACWRWVWEGEGKDESDEEEGMSPAERRELLGFGDIHVRKFNTDRVAP